MKKNLLLSLFILFIGNVNAQWTTDTTQNTNVRDTASVLSPLMASTANGSTYISWYEAGTNGLVLKMQLLDPDGNKLWGPGGIVVSNYPQTTSTSRYDLKTDLLDNAIVAFQDMRTGDLNVVAYKVDIAGTQLWGAAGISLIDSTSTQGIGPSIGITNENDVVVAWSAEGASKKWIACQRLSPSGVFEWNQIHRIKDTVTNIKYSRPKLFASGTKNIQMLYVEEIGSFPSVTSTMYTQRIDTAGVNLFPSPIQVSTKTIPYFFFPEPVPDDNGGFFVAFNTSNPVNPALNDVYVQNVDYNGALWDSAGVEAATSTTNHKTVTSSYYSSYNSEFWVVLQFQDAGQSNSGLNLQKFDTGGLPLLGADGVEVFPIDPNIYYLPFSISDAVDGVIVSCIYGGFGNEHIIAAKLDYSGILMWASGNVSLSAVNSNKDDVQAGKYVNDNLVFVWQDSRNNGGVYAQNINGAGQTGFPTGLSTIVTENNFVIYPNPAATPTIYFNDKKSEREITVFNLHSQKVFSDRIPSSDLSYNIKSLDYASPGIYFIKIQTKEKTETLKWLKE